MKQNDVGASEQQRSEVKSTSGKDIPDQQILFEDDSSSDSDANDNVEEAVEELMLTIFLRLKMSSLILTI